MADYEKLKADVKQLKADRKELVHEQHARKLVRSLSLPRRQLCKAVRWANALWQRFDANTRKPSDNGTTRSFD